MVEVIDSFLTPAPLSEEILLGHRIGYVRVSTFDQNPERQLDDVNVDRVFTDKVSGKDVGRPDLDRLLTFAREGDTVVVHRMDRLVRNVYDRRRLVSLIVCYVHSIEASLHAVLLKSSI